LNRKSVEVETKYGRIRIKFLFGGDVRKFKPEYEDVRLAADKFGVSFSDVVREAEIAAAKIEGDGT
jgi:uncharacterized protein (DUF111 family)